MNAGNPPDRSGRWIYDLDLSSMRDRLNVLGMPRYAASQVFAWLYRHRKPDMHEWTNIRLAHRDALKKTFSTELPEVVRESSDPTGTRKILLKLRDGNGVEAVWIPGDGRTTLCISTQVGCPLGCVFCATGSMGFIRQLSAGEILAQVLVLLGYQSDPDERINIVFMGMGEPLMNPGATIAAMDVLTGSPGMSISPRHITLSTVGLLGPLAEFERRFPRVKISVSLHAPDDATRRRLMPAAAARHSIKQLLTYFSSPRAYPVTFEYILIRGINTLPDQAKRLAGLLAPLHCKVNLIPFNPVPGCAFTAPSTEEEQVFLEILVKAGLSVTVRRSRGREIHSACGQLAGMAAGTL